MPDEESTTEAVLSKSALKKQLKRRRYGSGLSSRQRLSLRIEEQREARKSQRKQLRKEKKARKRQNEDNDEVSSSFQSLELSFFLKVH